MAQPPSNPQAGATGAAPVRAAPVVIGSAGQARVDTTGVQAAADVSANTLDAIGKLLGGVVDSQIATYKQQKYVEGVLRAQQGESAANIADQQVLGRLFGDGYTAAAARGYEVANNTTSVTNGILADMDNLRQLSPDQFRASVNERFRSGLTGDPATDSIMLQRFTEVSGPLAEAHTRAHVMWQDDEAKRIWVNGAQLSAQKLDTVMQLNADGKASDDTVLSAKTDFLLQAQAPIGTRPTAVKAGFANLYTTLMAGNHFHALNMLEDANVFEQLDPATVVQLREQRDVYESKMLATNPAAGTPMRKIGMIESKARLGQYGTEDELLNAIGEVNADATYQLGLKEPPINNKATDNLLQLWRNNKAQADAQVQKQLAEIASAGEQQQQIRLALYDPQRAAKGYLIGIAGDNFEVATRQAWETMSAEDQRKYIDSGAGNLAAITDKRLMIPQVQYTLNAGIAALANGQTNRVTPEAVALAARILSAPSGVEGLTAYVGADNAAKLQELVASGYVPGGDPKRNDELVKSLANKQYRQPSKDDIAAADTAVQNLSPGFFGKLMGKQTLLDAEAAKNLSPEVAGIIANLRANNPGADTDSLVRMAGTEVKYRYDFIGGVPIRKDARKGSVGFEESLQTIPGMAGLSMDSPLAQQAVSAVLSSKVPERYKIVGGVNAYGFGANHTAVVTVIGDSGVPHTVSISAGEIAAKFTEASKARAAAKAQPSAAPFNIRTWR